jgi:sugar lactone lactonase YvrE/enterochelin esterase-like enzyme
LRRWTSAISASKSRRSSSERPVASSSGGSRRLIVFKGTARRAACVASLLLAASAAAAQTDYPLTEDSERHPGTPAGTVTPHTWTSTIFPGTVRDYWVYVPAQYRAEAPPAVMVFQDGARFIDEKGRWRLPIVFDNLIHKGEMPVTIGVFIDPGVLPAHGPEQQARYNRSFEYDAVTDRYARFLLEEILPDVAKDHALTTDPNLRAIGGSSSGASCAFTVAWNRPDAFRRVLSFVGSFTGLRGADSYPIRIRKTEPRPLRVFLQDGTADNDIYSGSWWLGNQAMARALDYAGYDVTLVTGDQGHNAIHGSSVLPDALRWLWKDWSRPIAASKGRAGSERHFVTEILDPDQGWQLVSEGHQFTDGPAVDRQGDVYFTDTKASRIYKVDHATGRASLWKEDTGRAGGMMFGPDGRLYAGQGARKQIVAYSTEDGSETVIATEVEGNDLAVSARGGIYVTDSPGKRVWLIDAKGGKRVVHEGLEFPNGVRLSADQARLLVADYRTRWVWSFDIGADGALNHPEPFYRLETPDEPIAAGADGMAVDTEDFLYVTTRLGVQVCDPAGRVVAIIDKPQPSTLSHVVFAGPGLDWLYVTAGDKVFRRKIRRTGVWPWRPVKPPAPRL